MRHRHKRSFFQSLRASLSFMTSSSMPLASHFLGNSFASLELQEQNRVVIGSDGMSGELPLEQARNPSKRFAGDSNPKTGKC